MLIMIFSNIKMTAIPLLCTDVFDCIAQRLQAAARVFFSLSKEH